MDSWQLSYGEWKPWIGSVDELNGKSEVFLSLVHVQSHASDKL